MIFRNQALLTFAVALGLITAGFYIEKTSASFYVANANSGYSYPEVGSGPFVPSKPTPQPNPTLVDYPCPVDFAIIRNPVNPAPNSLGNINCQPHQPQSCIRYYRPRIFYNQPLRRGVCRIGYGIRRGIGRLFCWRR